MHMIRHQHIGVDVALVLLGGILQLVEVKMVILVGVENWGAIIAANNHMLRMTG